MNNTHKHRHLLGVIFFTLFLFSASEVWGLRLGRQRQNILMGNQMVVASNLFLPLLHTHAIIYLLFSVANDDNNKQIHRYISFSCRKYTPIKNYSEARWPLLTVDEYPNAVWTNGNNIAFWRKLTWHDFCAYLRNQRIFWFIVRNLQTFVRKMMRIIIIFCTLPSISRMHTYSYFYIYHWYNNYIYKHFGVPLILPWLPVPPT